MEAGLQTRFVQMPLVFLPTNYVKNRAVDVVYGLIPKLHKALRCYYAFEDGGWRSIEATTNHKNPDSENPSGRAGHECPSFALTVSGSAVDAYALDAQVADAHASWHESAVLRVQKLPTLITTSLLGRRHRVGQYLLLCCMYYCGSKYSGQRHLLRLGHRKLVANSYSPGQRC